MILGLYSNISPAIGLNCIEQSSHWLEANKPPRYLSNYLSVIYNISICPSISLSASTYADVTINPTILIILCLSIQASICLSIRLYYWLNNVNALIWPMADR